MRNFTIDQLEELLEETTPGPWERHPENPRVVCNLENKFAVHVEVGNNGQVSQQDKANTKIISLLPEIAKELISMKKSIRFILHEIDRGAMTPQFLSDYLAQITLGDRKNNQEQAAKLIADLYDDYNSFLIPIGVAQEIAQLIDGAGLLLPDLPQPKNGSDGSLVWNSGDVWVEDDEDVIYTDFPSIGKMSTDQARDFALELLSAVDHKKPNKVQE